MTLKQLSLNFIQLLASRKGPAKIRLFPYQPHAWFRGAYTTVQRTKAGGTPPALRSKVSALIFSDLPKLRAGTFDEQFEALLHKVASHGGFSSGQAQKLLNILLKYHLVYFYSGLDPVWNKKNLWVPSLLPKAHIPIDSLVLLYATLLYPDFFTRWIRFTANVKVAFPQGSKKRYAWSNLPFSCIQTFQSTFRTIANSKGISPLELEMRELWRP